MKPSERIKEICNEIAVERAAGFLVEAVARGVVNFKVTPNQDDPGILDEAIIRYLDETFRNANIY